MAARPTPKAAQRFQIKELKEDLLQLFNSKGECVLWVDRLGTIHQNPNGDFSCVNTIGDNLDSVE